MSEPNMQKPELKCEVAITLANALTRNIYLYATPDAAGDIAQFGALEPWGRPNYYQLEVDARYSFDEVVRWIETSYKREAGDTSASQC